MRKVTYTMSVSLDGFIESVNGDNEWAYPDEELHRHFNEREAIIDTFLYGRRMYETMTAYWPTADQNPSAPVYELEYARIWKSKPKVVFSRTLERVDWNSRLVRGDIAAEVQRLKVQQGGDLSVSGAGIAASFMRLDLIDEFSLYLHPIVLGGGKAMFSEMAGALKLQLVENLTFGSGVVLLRYQRVR